MLARRVLWKLFTASVACNSTNQFQLRFFYAAADVRWCSPVCTRICRILTRSVLFQQVRVFSMCWCHPGSESVRHLAAVVGAVCCHCVGLVWWVELRQLDHVCHFIGNRLYLHTLWLLLISKANICRNHHVDQPKTIPCVM